MRGSLAAIAFFQGLGGTTLYVVMAPLASYLNMSPIEYSSATSLFLLTSTISSLMWGRAADKLGTKVLMLVSSVIALLSALCLLPHSKTSLYVSNALAGISAGSQPVLFSYIARSEENLERAFGNFNAFNLIGGAIGSLLTVLISTQTEGVAQYVEVVYLSSLSYVLVLIFCSSLRDVRVRRRCSLKVSREIAGLVAFEGMLALGAAAGIWNFDFYLTLKYGSGLKSIGMLHFFQLFLQALGSYLSPLLSERLGLVRAYYLLTLPATIMIVLITFVNNFFIAYVLFIIRTALMNAANPLLQALLAKLTPKESLGTVSGLMNLSWNTFAFIGKNLGGALMQVNVELPLRFTFVDYLLSLGFLSFVLRRLRTSE